MNDRCHARGEHQETGAGTGVGLRDMALVRLASSHVYTLRAVLS